MGKIRADLNSAYTRIKMMERALCDIEKEIGEKPTDAQTIRQWITKLRKILK